MSSVQEIEKAMEALSAREMIEIYSWLDEQMAARGDAAIARDLDAGVFDEDIRIALADDKAGKVRGLSGWS